MILTEAQLDAIIDELAEHDEFVTVMADYPGGPRGRCLAFIVDDPARFGFNLGRIIAGMRGETIVADMDLFVAFANGTIENDATGKHMVIYPDVEVKPDGCDSP